MTVEIETAAAETLAASPAPEAKKKAKKTKVVAVQTPAVETAPAQSADPLTPGTPAPTQDATIEPTPVEPFTLFGVKPNGGPGSDKIIACEFELNPDNIVLAAKTVADMLSRKIDPKSYHSAIRTYRPETNFGRVTPMDEDMYAARVSHRLLNQIAGKRVVVEGAYSSAKRVAERLNSLAGKFAEIMVEKSIQL